MAASAVLVGTPLPSTLNTTTYATSSWTPDADAMYLVLISNSSNTDALEPTSVTGNGITWTSHATVQRPDIARRISAYRGLAGGSPSAGQITVTYSATQTSCLVHTIQLVGADKGGTNGSNAIVQAVTAAFGNPSTDPSITLSAFADPVNNCTVGALDSGNSDPSVGSGFSLLAESTVSSPTAYLITETVAGEDTSVDFVAAGGSEKCGIAFEIATARVPYINHMPQLLAH